jgi:protease-4
MKNKGLGCLIIFLVLALIASVAVNCLQLAASVGVDSTSIGTVRQKEKFTEVLEQEGSAKSRDRIVRIDLEGIISSTSSDGILGAVSMDVDGVKRALEQAVGDSSVKAIVLRVNSPGGEVTASDMLYNAVKEAAKKKKVVIYMDSLAASGGYYVSCGATKIVANETTLTGSIGVIIQSLNYSEAFGKFGLATMTFASGKFKDSLSGSRPMRDDEKAYVQSLVSDMYEKFVGIVSEARGISKDELKASIADGRVFTGTEAKKLKLVDQLGYVEDAYALARQLGSAPDAMVVKYQRHRGFGDLFGALGESRAQKQNVTVDITGGLLAHLQPGQMYLLPPHMVP